MAEISFIVLVGVDRPYLADALRSLQAQMNPSWEAVVVDACRDQGVFKRVREHVEALNDERLLYRWYPHETPPYPPYASRKWNYGVSQSSAPLVAWLDDDDMKQSTFVDEMSKPFRDDPALDVTVCGGLGFVDNSQVIGPVFGQPELTREALIGGGFITTGQLCVRRSAFDAVGGFDEECGCAEDYDFCLRLAGRRWRRIDSAQTLKRANSDSASAHVEVVGHTQAALRRIVLNHGIASESCRHCSASLINIGGFVRFSPGEGFRLFCGPHCARAMFGEE